MRLAVLSALTERPNAAGAGASERPALLRFAGKSVLAHQIDCASDLRCQRVLCLAPRTGPDLAASKAYAERAGLRFETVDSVPRLTAQVTADDDVILFDDGVLPDRAALIDRLGATNALLAFPADPAVSLGFERIDPTRAWAGVLRARGDRVARLADLPDDCDHASALLRIALQSGGQIVELDAALLAERTWQRRVDPHADSDSERRWIARHVNLAPFWAPGQAVVERIGLRLTYDAGSGRWARAPHLTALLLGILALAALLLDRPFAGLGALLAAQTARAVAGMFGRVEAFGAKPRRTDRLQAVGGWLSDGLLFALLTRVIFTVPSWLSLLLPALLIGLLHLGAASGPASARATFADRILLLVVVAPLAYAGWITPTLATIIVLSLGALLWSAFRKRGDELTPD